MYHSIHHASPKMLCLMFHLQHLQYMSTQPLFGQCNLLETDLFPLFPVPLRQRQMTVMTSGIHPHPPPPHPPHHPPPPTPTHITAIISVTNR